MDINKVLDIERKIIPESVDLLLKRYNIMKIIEMNQPIGRRNLAIKFGSTERIMRTEVEKLKELGMIYIESSGMILSKNGKTILKELSKIVFYMKGLSEIEEKLREKLGLKKVTIVPGDVNKDEFAFRDLGKKAANIIIELLEDKTTIGIAGGTTMACVANEMKEIRGIKDLMVLPARGGLGEELEIQANTISATMAEKLNAEYKLLHIPDNIDAKTLDALKENKSIKEVLDSIKNINLLIFGLGDAEDMAIRRNLSKELLEKVRRENLVAETFGYYFDKNGEIKMHTDSAGIPIEKFHQVKDAIGIAAGANKAEVIYSFAKFNKNFILVTDESAAKKILSL